MKHKWFLALAALVCALVFVFMGCSDPEGQQGQNEQAAPPAAGGHANVLVAYFSCTGNTEGVAELIAEKTGGTLWEIVPEVPYTGADLDYSDSGCRANREQNDENARPAIANEVEDIVSYDTVFIGHPIWWGDAPRIVQTFLESYDFSGKRVYTFSTSGSSSGSGAFNGLARKYPDIGLADNLHFTSSQLASAEARVQNFIEELGIMNNEQKNRISFTVGGETVYAALYDNSVARDLVSRLPLTLEFSDYNGTEKIAYLPDGSEDWDLSDAPTSCTPSAGDIAMYAPWGNLALFYRDFGYSNGLVPFGRLDDGAIELFASQNGDFAVTIRAA